VLTVASANQVHGGSIFVADMESVTARRKIDLLLMRMSVLSESKQLVTGLKLLTHRFMAIASALAVSVSTAIRNVTVQPLRD
jgi:hypothetical protein